MKSLQTFFSGLAVLILLAGCAQATTLPTSQPQATATNIVATSTPLPVNTATPTLTLTPIPPPTHRPTATIPDNLTPTITPLASFTRQPTSKATRTFTPTVTGTNTLYVRPPGGGGGGGGKTFTPENSYLASYKCSIASSYPAWGQTFKPRTDFIARWKVENSGENMWHKDDIIFGYVSGTKMHNIDRGNWILPYTLYVKDHTYFQIHMKPPKEPGIYTTTWGLRKTNKKEFFCLLSLTIEVVKK